MKTGAGLVMIGVGAILAFAVTTNTSVFNLHTAGWVIMIIGAFGIVMPRRTYGWIGARMVRRTRVYPSRRGRRVTTYADYDPRAPQIGAGPATRPVTVLTEDLADSPRDTEVIEEDVYEP